MKICLKKCHFFLFEDNFSYITNANFHWHLTCITSSKNYLLTKLKGGTL